VTFAGFELHFNNATVMLLLLVVVLQSLTGEVVPSLIAATLAAVCLTSERCERPPVQGFRTAFRSLSP
jgi:hypothetical protein